MENSPAIFPGGTHVDERGSLKFNNGLSQLGFDVKRFFLIEPKGFRGWNGHREEEKLFTVVNGCVTICVVKPDSWENPSTMLPISEYVLVNNGDTLYVPGGYATAFLGPEGPNTVLVHSNKSLEESIEDSYKFPPTYWYGEPTLSGNMAT